jgi:acyl carrier protein
MPDAANFERELLGKIVERLRLRDVDLDAVSRDTSLFENGLGLDSLDALEITVLLEEDYGIVVSVAERNETIFRTLGALSDFVQQHRGRDGKST